MEAVGKIVSVSLDTLQEQADYTTLPSAPNMAEVEGLGDEFLDALGEVKMQVSERSHNITETIANLEVISPAQLLQLQLDLAQVTLQQELISKGVTKSTQNIETVIKAQ